MLCKKLNAAVVWRSMTYPSGSVVHVTLFRCSALRRLAYFSRRFERADKIPHLHLIERRRPVSRHYWNVKQSFMDFILITMGLSRNSNRSYWICCSGESSGKKPQNPNEKIHFDTLRVSFVTAEKETISTLPSFLSQT